MREKCDLHDMGKDLLLWDLLNLVGKVIWQTYRCKN